MNVFIIFCVVSMMSSLYAQSYTRTGYVPPAIYDNYDGIDSHRGGSRWSNGDSWGHSGRGLLGRRGGLFRQVDIRRSRGSRFINPATSYSRRGRIYRPGGY